MSTKYISYIYKITTKEDKTRLYVGSTREKIENLLLFFIKDSNTNKQNNLYEWIRPLKKQLLKIKVIKSYPVVDKDEQKKREKYWIKKYETYGYEVIHSPYQIKNINKEGKLYVCFENVSMEEIIKRYGKKVICVSRNHFNFSENSSNYLSTPRPPPISLHKPVTNLEHKKHPSEPCNLLPVTQGDSYMNELKNLLTMRKTSDLSVAELAKKNKPTIIVKKDNIKIKKTPFKPPKQTINPGQELLDELKKTIKKID